MDYYYPFRGDNQCKTVDQRVKTSTYRFRIRSVSCFHDQISLHIECWFHNDQWVHI
jgi:hypothetical protein